ncbi:hypothetical protein MM300_13375 [Evansella sp. LMS18]|uniref:hypothetical protein n=1 Tax=Evansella sp. LMS18 TaxID=2924033 RepID=UPI0020D14B56|nr:hypothetical protein [Evansella sp. LMS18]UTR08925.1 hypothetical protein MM300_13375 [Evansella sp. LMS18]
MNISKEEFLQLVDSLTEDERRIVFTFIEELRIAEAYRFSKEAMRGSYDQDAH